MRVILYGLVCIGLLCVSSVTCREASVKECDSEFAKWMNHHNKTFDSSEIFNRYKIFCNNLDNVNEHNGRERKHFKKALNDFAAMTPAEYAGMLGFRPDPTEQSQKNTIQSLTDAEIQASIEWQGVTIDWVASGAVTPVKNQGSCGSCWSFSTTGAVEGAWKIKKGALVSLSEQQLLDCSKSGNYGCQGGSMTRAFAWIKSNGGITSEAIAPYVSSNGVNPHTTCANYSKVATISSYTSYAATETALLTALAKGPVSVAIQADQSCFQMYDGGILTEAECACGNSLNHGVLLVGAGTDAATGIDYWKIKNSWGTWWGEQGYIRIQRGGSKLSTGGQCGILLSTSQPIV